MKAGRMIAQGLEPEMIAGPFSETLQHLMSQPLYVMVRFGRWEDALREPKPDEAYGLMTAIWHYARGMAYRYTDDIGKARRELDALRAIAASEEMRDKLVGFAAAPAVLDIAGRVLSAEIASAAGEHDAAIAQLEAAVRIQDGFTYNEPPDWYFPVRHYLGAELLEAGRPNEAESVYWQDLARNPANGYALLGLQKALAAQDKDATAASVAERFRAAWSDADVSLRSSRF